MGFMVRLSGGEKPEKIPQWQSCIRITRNSNGIVKMKETTVDIHIKIMLTQLDRWYHVLDTVGDLFLIEDEESRMETIGKLYEDVSGFYQMVHWHVEDLQEKMETIRANN